MSNFFVNVQAQPVDGNGDVLAGAKVYFYDIGTTDERDVYTDAAKTTLHTQPVVADADGRFPAIYFQDGDYKYILTDASDVQIGSPQDNVPGPSTTTSGTGGSSETPVTVLTSATTLSTDDYGKHFELNATGGAFTVILPTAVDSNGKKIIFNKADSANAVTLTGASGQTINDLTSIQLDTVGDFANTTANGANHVAETLDVGTDSITITELDDTVTAYLKRVGEISPWATNTLPAGYLECDGSSLLRTDYPELFDEIGTLYGTADATHFNIPNYQGMFLRGQNNSRADAFADPDAGSRTAPTATGATASAGDNVGSEQTDQLASHTHTVGTTTVTGTVGGSASRLSADGNSSSTGGNETRPNNVYVKFIIFASPTLAAGASAGVINRLISGSGAPGAGTGIDGDFYVDTSTTPFTFYDEKASGAWPSSGFLSGMQWVSAGWVTSTNYVLNQALAATGGSYVCKLAHTSSASDEPGVGASWTTYWDLMASNGIDGLPGTNGTPGADGAPGTIGPAMGLGWTFSNATTSGDPGSGTLRLNHATFASVTEIYIDDLDISGTNVSADVDYWGASTSTPKGKLEIRDPAAPSTNYARFTISSVANSTGYRTVTVTNGVGAGTLPDGAEIKAWGNAKGDKGNSGSGSGDMEAATYDPGGVSGDAFTMNNMVEGVSAKILTNTERTKLSGIEANATADQTDAEIETAYNNQVGIVSQAEAEAGTASTTRRWTAERVKQAIAALGGGGGGVIVGFASATSTTAASTSSTIPVDNTPPQNTEGTEYLTVSYTPVSASNKLRITFHVPIIDSAGPNIVLFTLFRDSTADALLTSSSHRSAAFYVGSHSFQTEVSAAATTSTTFKVRYGVDVGSAYLLRNNSTFTDLFGTSAVAYLTVEEIAP